LNLKVIKLTGGATERGLDHEGSNSMDRFSSLRRKLEETRDKIILFCPSDAQMTSAGISAAQGS
jgi:hypothetical protein